MTRPRVLVIGSSNTDFIMQVPHLPSVGETVTQGRLTQTFGGKGANQAVAAARAGGDVSFVTCLGDDPFAEQMLRNFAEEGMDVSGVRRVAQQPSGAALIMFDDRGRNYLAVAPGANDRLTPGDIDEAESLIAAAAVVVLQMEVPPAVVERTLDLAHRRVAKTLLNYAPTRGLPVTVDARTSVLVVNENEAAELLGDGCVTPDNAAEAATRLVSRGPMTAVITLGEAGCVAVSDGETHRIEGLRVRTVDTTAAGDTFCGVLAVTLAEDKSLSEALQFANAAGALATTTAGAQPSIPRRADIDRVASIDSK